VYGDDLAHVHDAGFSFLAEAAAAELVRLLGERPSPARVVELGCGAGSLAARLTDAGHEVLGVDASPAMIALARRRAPAAQLAVGSFLDVEIPPCDAVCAVGEVLGYDADGRNGPRALARVLARAARALRPGGVLLFDLAGPGRVPGGRASRHDARADWAILVDAEESVGRVRRHVVLFREREGCYRRSEEVHELTLHAPREVLATLRGLGLSAVSRRAYPGAPALPGHRVYRARRPARSRPGATRARR
jgi:SAM-dependent methyltransferase